MSYPWNFLYFYAESLVELYDVLMKIFAPLFLCFLWFQFLKLGLVSAPAWIALRRNPNVLLRRRRFRWIFFLFHFKSLQLFILLLCSFIVSSRISIFWVTS